MNQSKQYLGTNKACYTLSLRYLAHYSIIFSQMTSTVHIKQAYSSEIIHYNSTRLLSDVMENLFQISGADFLCHACWELVSGHIEPPPVPTSGHRSICITCGRSILRIRSRTVLRPNMSEREMLLQNIIAEWIHPRQVINLW